MLPVDGLGGGAVDGGVGKGGGGGGVTITEVGAWSKLAMAEVRSRFAIDRDPPLEGADPFPAEATEPTVAALANGVGVEAFEAVTAEPVEGTPARGLAIDVAIGMVAEGAAVLTGSMTVRAACPVAVVDVPAAAAAADAMAGRLASFR